MALAETPTTITIDGNTSDFEADENVSGTSGSSWYFTWDNTNFYFATYGNPDVASNDSNKWVQLYIDTDPQEDPLSGNGTSTGVMYNTQQPDLPFYADFHIRWKADNNYTNMLDWNGVDSWTNDNLDDNNFGISGSQSGYYVELKIPRASLGNPSAVYVAGAMINEQSGGEWTFFMTPTDSNSNGNDADIASYFGFILDDNINPNSTANLNCYPVVTVTSNADSGNGSLRQAVDDACDGGMIVFDSSLADDTISLSSEIAINQTMTITNGNAPYLIISGSGADRVFNIQASAVVTISSVNISDGSVTNGGGIYNAGTLTLNNVTLSDNVVSTNGGGIYNLGTLILNNSTISGNKATSGTGGGIYNAGTLYLNSSTLSHNIANSIGGLKNTGSLHYKNTIIANSTNGDCDNSGTISTNTNNLVEDSTCSAGASGDPNLASLQKNGGSTFSHALLPGSSVIDVGDNATCSNSPINNLDQRGFTRAKGSACDIGATEYQTPPCFATLSNETEYTSVDAYAVQKAVYDATPGSIVKVAGYCAGVVNGQTLELDRSITVRGGYTITNWLTSYPITQPTTLDAEKQQAQVIFVANADGATVENLNLTGGLTYDNGIFYRGPGMYIDNSNITISNCVVFSNAAMHHSIDGGAMYVSNNSTVFLFNTDFLNNSAGENGGAISGEGDVTIQGGSFMANSSSQSFYRRNLRRLL